MPKHALQQRWQVLDAPYQANSGRGLAHGPHVVARYGQHPVCLVSSHGVDHFAGPELTDYKRADRFTGGLAMALAEALNLHFIGLMCRVAANNPHRGACHAEKAVRLLAQRVPGLVVVDVHGARAGKGFDWALGTAGHVLPGQQALIHQLTASGQGAGLNVALNPPGYQAKGARTLTHRLRSGGMEGVVQLELARPCRDVAAAHPQMAQTLQALHAGLCGLAHSLR